LQQIADLFETDKSGISRHIKNIYETHELSKKPTVAFFATVQKEGVRSIKRNVEYFNLDLILCVGYRVNSKKATIFRQWATQTLRKHILDGYTINRKRLSKNYDEFIKTVDDVKKLLPENTELKTESILELIKLFANTWLSLSSYDNTNFPKKGNVKRQVVITAEELNTALSSLKSERIKKGEASELFGQDKQNKSIEGIIGNVFQSFNSKDVYPTIEEKASHLLYFITKNHPFTDGNKRSGAFAFVWFLNKAKLLNNSKLSPDALTALTLLVAESNPKDKDKIIGLVLMLITH
jgi:prophage maintenance system killer protein